MTWTSWTLRLAVKEQRVTEGLGSVFELADLPSGGVDLCIAVVPSCDLLLVLFLARFHVCAASELQDMVPRRAAVHVV